MSIDRCLTGCYSIAGNPQHILSGCPDISLVPLLTNTSFIASWYWTGLNSSFLQWHSPKLMSHSIKSFNNLKVIVFKCFSSCSFLRALYTIPGNTPMFWQKISREVGSRTAQECQFQHQGEVLVSNKKTEPSVKKGSAKEKKNPVQKGTNQIF